MTKNQLLALAAFITSLANESCEGAPATETTPDAPKRRGRPPKTEETPPPAGEQEQPPKEEKPVGRTDEENEADYQKLRGVIEPHVKEGKGPEVKAIIKKYAPEQGTLKELATMPEKHAAFAKDIEALAY